MGRKKDGNEIKKVYSIRLEPKTLRLIKKQFGGLQNFINFALSLIKKGESDE